MKRFTAQLLLAVALSAILGGSIAQGFDQKTTAYLHELDQQVVAMERNADPLDRRTQNKVNAVRATIKGINISMGNCPFRNLAEAERTCNIRWSIKMRSLYSFMYE